MFRPARVFAWSGKTLFLTPCSLPRQPPANIEFRACVASVVAGRGDQGSGCAPRSCSHIAGETHASGSPFEVVALSCHAAASLQTENRRAYSARAPIIAARAPRYLPAIAAGMMRTGSARRGLAGSLGRPLGTVETLATSSAGGGRASAVMCESCGRSGVGRPSWARQTAGWRQNWEGRPMRSARAREPALPRCSHTRRFSFGHRAAIAALLSQASV